MKILQVINAYHPPYSSGGAAFVAHNISKILAKRGHEVTVYTSNVLSRDRLFRPEQNPNYDNGVKVYYFSNIFYKPSIHIYFSKELVEAIKKSVVNYDVVHLHEYRSHMSLVTSYFARKYSVPYVLQAHGQLPRIMAKQKLKWIFDVLFGYRLLREASKVIALSRKETQQYRSMGVRDEKIEIIPNGIDLSEYGNLPPKGGFRAKYGISEDKKIVLYLGRIHKIKGIDFLIEAYAHIVKNPSFNDTLLVIAGPDDGYLSEVKSMVNLFKINDRTIFTGPVYGREKLEVYVDADAYILPSRHEAFPTTILEAMSCGVPVILSENCGIADVVRDNGALVIAPSAEGVQSALLKLLTDEELAKEMGERGRRFVFENYDWKNIVPRFEALYQSIVRSKGQ